jgi:hypothetical protein
MLYIVVCVVIAVVVVSVFRLLLMLLLKRNVENIFLLMGGLFVLRTMIIEIEQKKSYYFMLRIDFA